MRFRQTHFKVGDFAQWNTPLCVVLVGYVDELMGTYEVWVIPGVNGTPSDLLPGNSLKIGNSILEPLEPQYVTAARQMTERLIAEGAIILPDWMLDWGKAEPALGGVSAGIIG
jgi:hypothetical protein